MEVKNLDIEKICPDWCGSVQWAWHQRTKDSQSGYRPGLRAWSPFGSV